MTAPRLTCADDSAINGRMPTIAELDAIRDEAQRIAAKVPGCVVGDLLSEVQRNALRKGWGFAFRELRKRGRDVA